MHRPYISCTTVAILASTIEQAIFADWENLQWHPAHNNTDQTRGVQAAQISVRYSEWFRNERKAYQDPAGVLANTGPEDFALFSGESGIPTLPRYHIAR